MDEFAKELSEVATEIAKVVPELKSALDKQKAETAELGKSTSETNTLVQKLGADHTQIHARLMEIEQRLARRGNGGQQEAEAKTWGEALTTTEGFKALASGEKGRAKVTVQKDAPEQRAIVNLGTISRPQRGDDVIPLAQRRMTIRNLIPALPVAGNAVEYVRQSAFTNAAAPVAENTAKPYSDNTFTLVSVAVRTLAHLQKVSRQSLDDVPFLRAFIDQIMRYGLAYVEEQQILTGDGTGQNLSGLITNATAYATARSVTGDVHADILSHAITQVAENNYEPTGIVLSVADWEKIRLRKDTSGAYIGNSPFEGVVGANIWGLPVVASPAVATGRFIVGAFRQAAVIYDRMDVEVLVSTENVDDFEKNMATVRAEERLALAVTQPAAIVTGTFPTIPVP